METHNLFNNLFFQAEDGIRSLTVTGAQTCALPICCSTTGSLLLTASSSTTPTSRVSAAPASPWPTCRRGTRPAGWSPPRPSLGGQEPPPRAAPPTNPPAKERGHAGGERERPCRGGTAHRPRHPRQ